ncbi:12071_t:CDS:10 [Ambispora gerdemannii]|uniref:12071_t:CDS:1 n=1 Tax=Ambispora gerdemannii TaxID=144530 RepID=A0A9N9FA17_9GLOM|nr:12071_t:CDS:10 [Ambispora gerdemannii]
MSLTRLSSCIWRITPKSNKHGANNNTMTLFRSNTSEFCSFSNLTSSSCRSLLEGLNYSKSKTSRSLPISPKFTSFLYQNHYYTTSSKSNNQINATILGSGKDIDQQVAAASVYAYDLPLTSEIPLNTEIPLTTDTNVPINTEKEKNSTSSNSADTEIHAVVSTFDLFSIGIGPSSSHTVGPMRAAKIFINDLKSHSVLEKVHSLRIDLFGSLALTGRGHGTPNAILMGMEGETPEGVETSTIASRVESIYNNGILNLDGSHPIQFEQKHLIFHFFESLPQHPNGMRFCAFNKLGDLVATNEFFSIGGGFVVNEATQIRHGENLFYKSYDKSTISKTRTQQDMAVTRAALPFSNAKELLSVCKRENLTIAQVVYENELRWRSKKEISKKVMDIWETMNKSIENGCLSSEEYLPGKLQVKRRAPRLYEKLLRGLYSSSSAAASGHGHGHRNDITISLGNDQITHLSTREILPHPLPKRQPKRSMLPALEYLSVYAISVNEENAAGGRVVTAPTNGAAGVIPAVLKYYLEFISTEPEHDVMEFLFTSAAIGMLYKRGASISAAEMGCQGEVGVACSMSAAAFTAVMGGTPEQVENAAEIGMEHNLGLTCDPIDGLVQIPCIERNALGAVKAVTAAQLALNGDGHHRVTLDQVIETMRQTGIDMQSKYKETSQGGLAVNVPVC